MTEVVAQTTTAAVTQLLNVSANVTTATKGTSDSFCIECGFDFGTIINGVDNKIAGFILVFLLFTLLCTPCIVMACCYLFCKNKAHRRKNKRSRGKRYNAAADNDDDDDDDNNSDQG